MTRSKLFDYSFIAFGLLVQVVTYVVTNYLTSNPLTSNPLTPISLISGCLGVCSVCLAAQGNIWTYAFGFGQDVNDAKQHRQSEAKGYDLAGHFLFLL